MSYQSTETCQIRVSGEDGDSGLVIHEGPVPRCGQQPLTWHGKPTHVEALGAGSVTCLRCARCVS